MFTKNIYNCPVCGSSKNQEILSLPNLPITELLYESHKNIDFELTKANQKLNFCEDCGHGFLGTIVDPKYLYSSANYNTITSQSKGAQKSINNFASFILKHKVNREYCIDIGGNDSSLLKKINACSGSVIDPNCKIESNSNYKAINKFYESVENEELPPFEITLVSSHTLEHIESPKQFFRFLGSKKNLNNVFIQFPCLELMSESCRYDLVHNQHLHYYSLHSIAKIAFDYGFHLQDYEYDVDHYGTLRVFISKNNYAKEELIKLKKLTLENLMNSIGTFQLSCKATNSLLDNLDEFYCYGASLMLPLIYYHHPKLHQANCIFDSDMKKSKLRYANIDTPINYDDGNTNLTSLSIFITAVSTRIAHRNILKNLINRNPKYIISPFSTL